MNCNAPILDDEKPTPWHTPLVFMGVDLMDYVQRKKELNGPGDSVDRNIKKEHRIGPDRYFSDDGETRGRLFADIKKILNEQGSNVFQEWDKKKKMLRVRCSHYRPPNRCKFQFALYWNDVERYWYIKRGPGVRFHTCCRLQLYSKTEQLQLQQQRCSTVKPSEQLSSQFYSKEQPEDLEPLPHLEEPLPHPGHPLELEKQQQQQQQQYAIKLQQKQFHEVFENQQQRHVLELQQQQCALELKQQEQQHQLLEMRFRHMQQQPHNTSIATNPELGQKRKLVSRSPRLSHDDNPGSSSHYFSRNNDTHPNHFRKNEKGMQIQNYCNQNKEAPQFHRLQANQVTNIGNVPGAPPFCNSQHQSVVKKDQYRDIEPIPMQSLSSPTRCPRQQNANAMHDILQKHYGAKKNASNTGPGALRSWADISVQPDNGLCEAKTITATPKKSSLHRQDMDFDIIRTPGRSLHRRDEEFGTRTPGRSGHCRDEKFGSRTPGKYSFHSVGDSDGGLSSIFSASLVISPRYIYDNVLSEYKAKLSGIKTTVPSEVLSIVADDSAMSCVTFKDAGDHSRHFKPPVFRSLSGSGSPRKTPASHPKIPQEVHSTPLKQEIDFDDLSRSSWHSLKATQQQGQDQPHRVASSGYDNLPTNIGTVPFGPGKLQQHRASSFRADDESSTICSEIDFDGTD